MNIAHKFKRASAELELVSTVNETDRIEKIKEACRKLFSLKDDFKKYEEEAIKIADKVHKSSLDHTIDPGQLRWFLINPVKQKKLSEIDRVEFNESIDEYLRVKKTDYYFQLAELRNFPDNYQLGHVLLLKFNSLPQPVKDLAKDLSRGKAARITSQTRIWEEIFPKLLIPIDPKLGHWLKTSVSAVSSSISTDRGFESAENSLDILRIAISTARFHLPQYAIGLDSQTNKAFHVAKGIEFNKYTYNPKHQKLIDRLSSIYVKTPSELERRIQDAIHFLRIADNNSPDYQRLFFYVAAIERMILTSKPPLTHKFAERGAILLRHRRKKRLKMFRDLKKLYGKRSSIAHGRSPKYDFYMTTDARRYVRCIIKRLLYLIDTYQLKTVSKKEKKLDKSLTKYIRNIIYS